MLWLPAWLLATRGFGVDRPDERPKEIDDLISGLRQLRLELAASNRTDEMFASAGLFPLQVRQLSKRKSEIVKICDCILASLPKDNANATSQDRGGVLGFETFFDELQGVQR